MPRFELLPLIPLAALTLFAAPAAQAPKVLDGKQVFLDQKCQTCHAVSSADIKATGKVKAPDLTGKAATVDAAKLAAYLRRNDTVNGKKHVKPFTGSDEQMGAMIAWLQKQKAKAK